MPGPAPQRITVTPRQRRVLEQLIRRHTSPQQAVRRATVILAAAAGATNEQAARQAGLTADTARLWRGRWAGAEAVLRAAETEGDAGALADAVLAMLADAPRAGAPATFTPEQICQIVALACEPPSGPTARPISHWTPRELAAEAITRGIVATISPQSVARFLKGGRPAAPPEPVLAHAGPG